MLVSDEFDTQAEHDVAACMGVMWTDRYVTENVNFASVAQILVAVIVPSDAGEVALAIAGLLGVGGQGGRGAPPRARVVEQHSKVSLEKNTYSGKEDSDNHVKRFLK